MKHAGAGFLSAVEMGGASAQLTFPLPAASTASLQRHPQFHALEIGHARVQIYTHSYLGLGLDEVRSAFKARTLAAKAADPCLPAGFPTALAAPPSESPQDQQQQQQQQQPDGAKPGQSVEQQRGFAGCLEGVRRELGLVEPATCVERPCGLRGVHQPSFWREPGVLVAFEHFRHASAALGLLSEATQGPASEAETAWSAGLEDKPWEDRLSVARLRAAAEEVCGARWEEIVAKEGEGAGKYGRMRQGQEHEYCFRYQLLGCACRVWCMRQTQCWRVVCDGAWHPGADGTVRRADGTRACASATYLWAFLVHSTICQRARYAMPGAEIAYDQAEGLGVPADTEFKALLELQVPRSAASRCADGRSDSAHMVTRALTSTGLWACSCLSPPARVASILTLAGGSKARRVRQPGARRLSLSSRRAGSRCSVS